MKKKTPWTIFLAILLAIFVGSWAGTTRGLFGIPFFAIFDLLGTLFLNALMLVVVPLVSSSIISGISRVGAEGNLGRLGAKMFSFYLGTSLLAILIGLFFVNAIGPGFNMAAPELPTVDVARLQDQVSNVGGRPFLNFILSIVPPNIIHAFGQGHMIGIITFSLVFGYAISQVNVDSRAVLHKFWVGIFEAMINITHLVMRVLPLGVFCLVAKVFATTGLQSLKAMGLFAVTVLLGLAGFVFIGLPALLKFVGRVSPVRHFRAMGPALITAFSTSSSSATLPITMECVEKRAGVSNRIASLVIPLGTSINMSGSALYECVAALFIAQVYGIDLSFSTQFLIVLMSLIASIGVAGIPSASLVAILVILRTVGLPPEGLGLLLAVDRLLDMCRTTVNVFSDSCCAILVARLEGEEVLK